MTGRDEEGAAIGRGILVVLAAASMAACSSDRVVGPTTPALSALRVSGVPVASYSEIVLPTGGYGCGRANAVNNSGVVGGNVFLCALPSVVHAALWVNGTLTVLPSIAPQGSSNVMALASNGVAVGFSIDADGVSHATMWQNGAMTILPGGQSSSAVSIDAAGVVAGSIMVAGVRTPALWFGGQLFTDAVPNGYVGARFNSIAVGVVAGTALNPVNGIVRGVQAFRWYGPGSYQLLTLPAVASSVALGQVNNSGSVAGVAFGELGGVSVLWPGGSTLPVVITVPLGFATSDLRTINNSGVMAGSLTGIGLGATVYPAVYNPNSGRWARLPTNDSYAAVYDSDDSGRFAGATGLQNAIPVLWVPKNRD
ncbi:MAG: hypothetical protein M3Z10_02125 [Gemmatimonadota bacterium]|nr:hypothetical protein [Gemmatimonadota bacterium]